MNVTLHETLLSITASYKSRSASHKVSRANIKCAFYCIICAIKSVMKSDTHHPKTCQCIHQICNYRLGRWLQWDPFHHSYCGMLMPPNHLSWRANTSQTCCYLDSEGLGLNMTSTGQSTSYQGCQEFWMK